MIKNKKYKSFSLIEAMILFLTLSLILLAFIPIFLKRPQKAAESDCVGGLRSVRREFTPGEYDFRIPDSIASPISVVLVGAGEGGGNPTSEYREEILPLDETGAEPTCSYTMAAMENPQNYTYYKNKYLTVIGNGRNADCNASTPKAGDSGDYYYNIRIFPAMTSATTGKVFEFTLKNDGSITSDTFFYGNETVNQFKLDTKEPKEIYMKYASSTKYYYFPAIKNSGDKDNGSNTQKLVGGAPVVKINNKDGKIAGVGQGCTWDSSGSKYIADENAPATKGVCKISYRLITPGFSGGSGAFLRLLLPLDAGVDCVINVGEGGVSNGGAGGNTSISCNNNTMLYRADGAKGDTDAQYYSSSNILDDNNIIWQRHGIHHDTTSDSKAGSSNYTSSDYKGGINGCNARLGDSPCFETNGQPGFDPGSGGGAGVCDENGCGTGGRGGDGVAIVEYLEYCK